jgi:anaerobic dimethyl sulfoxide reductase subunit B (iron-sulfur subunit)
VTYAFTFDASACSGCKACQVACKDKNNLPVGVLWRRVYEVSGGTWTKQNDAWVTDVFAYNLSIACNHCVHPKCAGVCPTDAYVQREDGIVYIDESKCIGCGYCNWACPYGVPQYDPLLGHMTKCNFCMDNIDAGLPPACVAACPLRVLDFVTVDTSLSLNTGDGPLTVDGRGLLWLLPASEHPFPMPENSRTEPHLVIRPHKAMTNTLEKAVSNREEIKPAKTKSELPLVAFTLLGQMAAGIAAFTLFSGPLTVPVLITIGALIGTGGLVSLLHLGAPKNAWRAVIHLRKSWLSREILMFGLFGGSWLVAMALPGMGKLPLALCGIGLIYSMAQVYRLRSMPAWDTNRTLLAFLVSMVLLGGIGVDILSGFWDAGFMPLTNLAVGVGLIAALEVSLSERNQTHQTARRLRSGLIGLGLVGMLGTYVVPNAVGRWLVFPIFVIVLIEEALGRWLFYQQLHQRIL